MSATAQLLTAVLLAMAAFTVVVLVIEAQNKHADVLQEVRSALADREGCYGSGIRSVRQLRFNWDEYTGNLAIAQASTGVTPQIKRIRGLQAAIELGEMKAIAADRVEAHDYGLLEHWGSGRYHAAAPLLARIVHKTGFSCNQAYPLPPGGEKIAASLDKMPPPTPQTPRSDKRPAS